MTTVSELDLRNDFPRIEKLLREGEELQITKSGKVIAHILPPELGFPPLPDFAARVKEIYGDRVLDVSGAELISTDRDRF